MSDKSPYEIAKETLMLLRQRNLSPTPMNYQKIYCEVSGLAAIIPFPIENLLDIESALPAKTPGQEKYKGLLNYSIKQLNWAGVKAALIAYGGFVSLDEEVFSRVENSVQENTNASGLTREFLMQLARLIVFLQPALDDCDSRFLNHTDELLKLINQPVVDIFSIKKMLASYSDRLSFVAEDQAEIKKTLFRLLNLVFQNISELSDDEHWLKGQVDALLEVSSPPLTLRKLDEVERRLKDVILKQKEAKGRLLEAQEEMRKILATFIERLLQITETTGSFQKKMGESVRLIEQAKSITEISPVLKDVMLATHNIAQESKASRDELIAMRLRANQTQEEISKLHQELDLISAQVRHDPLTGALNRQGLEEALNKEISNVDRKDIPLCIALLDIDDFKKINDLNGHLVGDAALAHLAAITRECLRPHDSLARYGGEEFVVLLPDTVIDDGIEVLVRLQRELSKRFFLASTEKILITFSAGIVQFVTGETAVDAIKRADKAMYLAKRAGKNRVVRS